MSQSEPSTVLPKLTNTLSTLYKTGGHLSRNWLRESILTFVNNDDPAFDGLRLEEELISPIGSISVKRQYNSEKVRTCSTNHP